MTAFRQQTPVALLYNSDPKCGTQSVRLRNAASAALYTYTPYVGGCLMAGCALGGAQQFKQLFNRWFKAPLGQTFTDVPKANEFFADIEWPVDRKITTGVAQLDGSVKFLPGDRVTRGQMAAFLSRAAGVQGYAPVGPSPFLDVKPGDAFYAEIMWAYEHGVTTGTRDAKTGGLRFDAATPITRGDRRLPASGRAGSALTPPASATRRRSRAGVGPGAGERISF